MLMHSRSALDTAAFHLIYTHIYTFRSEIGWDIDFCWKKGWGKCTFFLMSTKSTMKGKLEIYPVVVLPELEQWVQPLPCGNYSHFFFFPSTVVKSTLTVSTACPQGQCLTDNTPTERLVSFHPFKFAK